MICIQSVSCYLVFCLRNCQGLYICQKMFSHQFQKMVRLRHGWYVFILMYCFLKPGAIDWPFCVISTGLGGAICASQGRSNFVCRMLRPFPDHAQRCLPQSESVNSVFYFHYVYHYFSVLFTFVPFRETFYTQFKINQI
jgi:hypothetical protein